MGYKTKIRPSGEICPCGTGAYDRFAICNEEFTDGLNLHYDICSRCGFETYAHVEPALKLERFVRWGGCAVDKHTEARLEGERIMRYVGKIILVGITAAVIVTIMKVTQ